MMTGWHCVESSSPDNYEIMGTIFKPVVLFRASYVLMSLYSLVYCFVFRVRYWEIPFVVNDYLLKLRQEKLIVF